MTDLRAAVEGLGWSVVGMNGMVYLEHATAALRDYEQRVLALIPEGAVLVTEEGLARAWWNAVNEPEEGPWDDASDNGRQNAHEWVAAILRHLRETP